MEQVNVSPIAEYLSREPDPVTHRTPAPDELTLRQLLWLNHGCSPVRLYGDDGEMQCQTCMIDFKRSSPESIKRTFFLRGLERYNAEAERTRATLAELNRRNPNAVKP